MKCHQDRCVYWCPLGSHHKTHITQSDTIPMSQLKSHDDYTFSVAASTLWNILAVEIRNVSSLENLKSVF